VTFPPNWKELSMKRSAATKLTVAELKIHKALDTVIPADYDGHTLEQVLDHLTKVTGLTFLPEKAALEDAGVTYEGTRITLKTRATTRTILRKIFGDLGLAYFVKNETINITTPARAKEETTTRVYYLGDLASAVDVRYGPAISQLQMMENVNRIMTLITQTIEPQSWKVNNPDAPGTISFEPITMSLVVKQSAEMHYRIIGAGR